MCANVSGLFFKSMLVNVRKKNVPFRSVWPFGRDSDRSKLSRERWMIVVASILILVQRDRISTGYYKTEHRCLILTNLYRQIEYLLRVSHPRHLPFGTCGIHHNFSQRILNLLRWAFFQTFYNGFLHLVSALYPT